MLLAFRCFCRSLRTFATAVPLVFLMLGCQPRDSTPGLWLNGDPQTTPVDWTFTDAYREIFVQVATPYFLPHSVTIWCAQVDGTLYIGARNPDSKNWVGWMAERSDIRLKIGDGLYDVRANDFDNDETLAALKAAYREKYELPESGPNAATAIRYWQIGPRG